MDIDRVRYFCVFADTGSLVRASELLHISQPALSKALRLLEREVGLSLIEPEGRGLRLTQAGRAFKAATQPLLSHWLGLPEVLKKVSLKTQTITRLGSFEVFTTYFLGYFLRGYSTEGELEVHELTPGSLEDAILDGKIDLGITYLPIPRAGVSFTEATKIRMGVFGVREFKSRVQSDIPFVIPIQPTQGTPTKITGLDGWPDHKIPRSVKYRVTMMESALELCRRGLAVAYLPEFVVRLHNTSVKTENQLLELDCPVPKSERMQSVYLVQKASDDESTLGRAVAKALRTLR